jgi:hypothetical protein
MLNNSKKVDPGTNHEGPEGEKMESYTPSLTSALDGGGWSTPRPSPFTPEKDPVPIVQETVWVLGSVWTAAKNLFPTEIRSPDRPARSEFQYRLSYPGLRSVIVNKLKLQVINDDQSAITNSKIFSCP